jgi:hypothetical protein
MTSKARQIADYVLGLFTDRATGNVGIGTSAPAASGLEISRATGAASPTPAELRLSTTTNEQGTWSTTDPWGRLSFYSADVSTGGAKVQAAIQTVAGNNNGGFSLLEFLVVPSTGSGVLQRALRLAPTSSEKVNTIFSSDSATETMRITSAGNVGIGTSSPAQQLHSTDGQIFGQNKKLSFTGDFTATATPKINLTLNSTSTPRLSCFIYLFGRDVVNSLSVATTILSVSVGSTARNVSVVNSTGQNNVASASIALSGNDLVITLTVNAVSPSTVGYTNMRGYVDIIEDNQSITAVSVSG